MCVHHGGSSTEAADIAGEVHLSEAAPLLPEGAAQSAPSLRRRLVHAAGRSWALRLHLVWTSLPPPLGFGRLASCVSSLSSLCHPFMALFVLHLCPTFHRLYPPPALSSPLVIPALSPYTIFPARDLQRDLLDETQNRSYCKLSGSLACCTRVAVLLAHLFGFAYFSFHVSDVFIRNQGESSALTTKATARAGSQWHIISHRKEGWRASSLPRPGQHNPALCCLAAALIISQLVGMFHNDSVFYATHVQGGTRQLAFRAYMQYALHILSKEPRCPM